MIYYNPKTCHNFFSQQHDSIGWVKPSPKVSSDRPETFASCKRSRDGQSIGSREVFGRVSRAEGQQEL